MDNSQPVTISNATKWQKFKLYLQDFWRYRYLIYNLISRDFKLKYRRSVLGVVWSVLNPLLMSLVMYLVFSSMFANMRGGGIENYAVFLLIGQILFSLFNEATNSAMASVLSSAPLLRKVYIPKYIFPLEKVCFSLVNCVFSLVALVILMLFTGAPFHWTAILAVYPLLTLFGFCLGVGLFLAMVTVFFRDIMHIWSVFCTALMYFSAVFYDPAQLSGPLQSIIRINPLYWYITAFRRVVLDGQLLTGNMILVCGGCALVSLAVGFWSFRKKQDQFVLHL